MVVVGLDDVSLELVGLLVRGLIASLMLWMPPMEGRLLLLLRTESNTKIN